MAVKPCQGCGTGSFDSNQTPIPERCETCPPELCSECGKLDSIKNHCPCWINVDGLPLADIKAIFALGDFNIKTPS